MVHNIALVLGITVTWTSAVAASEGMPLEPTPRADYFPRSHKDCVDLQLSINKKAGDLVDEAQAISDEKWARITSKRPPSETELKEYEKTLERLRAAADETFLLRDRESQRCHTQLRLRRNALRTAREVSRLDALAKTITGTPAMERLNGLDRMGELNQFVRTVGETMKAVRTLEELADESEAAGAAEAVLIAYGDDELSGQLAIARAYLKDLKAETWGIPETRQIDIGVDALVLPEQRREFVAAHQDLEPVLERYAAFARDRARTLKSEADQLKGRAGTLFQYADFLELHAVELGAAHGLVVGTSPSAAGIVAKADQARKIAGVFEDIAATQRRLARKYDANLEISDVNLQFLKDLRY